MFQIHLGTVRWGWIWCILVIQGPRLMQQPLSFLQLSITMHKERVRSGGSHCENQEVQPRSHPVHFSYNSFCRTSHMVLFLTIKGIDVWAHHEPRMGQKWEYLANSFNDHHYHLAWNRIDCLGIMSKFCQL